MCYAIEDFRCTAKAQEHLIHGNDDSLNGEETGILRLIDKYHQLVTHHSSSANELRKIQLCFNNLYASVNLTRLVILKFLEFQHHEEQVNTDNSSYEDDMSHTPKYTLNHIFQGTQLEGILTEQQAVNSNDSFIETQSLNILSSPETTNSLTPTIDSVDPILGLVSGNYMYDR